MALTYRSVFGTTAVIQRIGDGAFIPVDVDNRDYREFLDSGAILEGPVPLPGPDISLLVVDQPTIVRARVRLDATTFSLTSGVPLAITWTSATVDPLSMWNPSSFPARVTIAQTGIYRFIVGIRFTETVRIGTRTLVLARGLGGSPTDVGAMILAPALDGDTSFSFTDFTALVQGDVLRLFAIQGSGGAMNATARLTLIREE